MYLISLWENTRLILKFYIIWYTIMELVDGIRMPHVQLLSYKNVFYHMIPESKEIIFSTDVLQAS